MLVGFAAAVLCAFAAGWSVNGWRLEATRQTEIARALKAGQVAVARHDADSKIILEDYREKLAALAARPPKRVLFCPTSGLPATAGGAPGAGSAAASEHDYGPDLREARDYLLKYNALIESVRPKP